MEKLVIDNLFGGIYKGKRVLVTGHTGFKGSWLSLWLNEMGAIVHGIALEPPTKPSHFELLNLSIESNICNINNLDSIKVLIKRIDPEIIFHLAAQPLVRESYLDPLYTLQTNIIGTANILEASRELKNLKAILIITSDKCYENKEWVWGYRENEAFGGKDPYSASKGCAEIVTAAYRNSFYNSSNTPLIATARAGNVIGGGDWAKDRLITDLVLSVKNGKSLFLRYPNSTRPWQYVLEPLSGYLSLGSSLLMGKYANAKGWNFGPNSDSNVAVIDLVTKSKKYWNKVNFQIDNNNNPHEAGYLMLDSSQAHQLLGWKPIWNFDKTIDKTISWYKSFYEEGHVQSIETLFAYILDAKKGNVEWTF